MKLVANFFPSTTPDSKIRATGIWVLCISIFLVVAILCSEAAGSLHLLFPVLAFLVGLILRVTWPAAFLGFVFWLWLLSPVIRRLVDYRSAFVDPSPILLAPLLVMCLVMPSSLKIINQEWKAKAMPFASMLAALGPGLIPGLTGSSSFQDILKDLAIWTVPLLWGCYLAFHKDVLALRSAFEKHFSLAVLLLGLYAIFQFLVAPSWDRFWLENLIQQNSSLGEQNSFGNPAPLEMRVWSTTNGPGVFGITMMAGLLLLMASKSTLRIPAALIGVISLILSQVRISWVCFAIGMALLVVFGPEQRKVVLMFAGICILLVAPLTALPGVQDIISQRVATFARLDEDDSLKERSEMHGVVLSYVAANPLGRGLGTPLISYKGFPLDTGILNVPFVFGWAGTVLIGLALYRLCRGALRVDAQALGLKIVFFCILLHLPAGEITTGPQGFLFWTSAGLLIGCGALETPERLSSRLAFGSLHYSTLA